MTIHSFPWEQYSIGEIYVEKIRIGQIGIGHNHGEEKMKAIRKFPELFEVVGYAEKDSKWIERRGDLPGYNGLQRMSVEDIID